MRTAAVVAAVLMAVLLCSENLCAGLSDLLSALPAGVLDEVRLESCRSVSRGVRQAAARGVAQLQDYLAAEHA